MTYAPTPKMLRETSAVVQKAIDAHFAMLIKVPSKDTEVVVAR